jgi:hypothetical protein
MKMQSTAAAIVEDIHAVRNAQDRAFARLGGTGPSLQQQRQIADDGARLRELFADLELELPKPGATDRPMDFQVRLLRPLQRFSPDWRRTDLAQMARHGGMRGLDDGIARAILADAARVASDKTVGSFRVPGELRKIIRADQAGQESIAFHGSPLSWMRAFFPPVVACVESFSIPRR